MSIRIRKPKSSALQIQVNAIQREVEHAIGVRAAGEGLILSAGERLSESRETLRALANERELEAQLANEDAASLRHIAGSITLYDGDVASTFALASNG